MTTTQCSAQVELTVLMPCLNEARTIGTCVAKAKSFLAAFGVSGEVVVADNGSTDGSQEIAARLGARVVPVRDRGYGAALLGGIVAAHGRYVVMGDADDSYDFENLAPFLDQLRAGHDLVMGNRFSGGIAPGAMPWHHKYIGNPVLSFVARLFFQSPVRDFHCGLRAFRRDAVLSLGLSTSGMEFASEMIVKATLRGLKVCEVPTTLKKDGRDRPPHLRSFRDGWRHLRFLLLHSPKWLFLYPALFLLVLGATSQAALFNGTLQFGEVGFGVHTMLYAAAITVLGVQLLAFWAFGQLIAWRDGVLPDLPPALAWIAARPLEFGLLTGAALFLLGGVLAFWAATNWAAAGFAELDPTVTMRTVIPTISLMLTGAELAFASCVVSILKLTPPRSAALSAPLPSTATQ